MHECHCMPIEHCDEGERAKEVETRVRHVARRGGRTDISYANPLATFR